MKTNYLQINITFFNLLKKQNWLLLFFLVSIQFATAQLPGSGNAIKFDGVDDYVTIPHSSSLEINNQITVETWVKIDALPTLDYDYGTILANGLNGIFSIQYYKVPGNQLNILFILNGTFPDGSYDGKAILGTIPQYVLGSWMHLALTYDGNTLKAYKDGFVFAQDDVTLVNLATNTIPISIGATIRPSDGLLTYPHNGCVDEVRIWDQCQTQAMIRDRLCKKITNADLEFSHLKAYFNCDAVFGGTTLADQTTNGNTAILQNGAYLATSGASIGDVSTYSFFFGPGSVSLTAPRGDVFTADVSNYALGTYVYYVNQSPSNLTGSQGVGGSGMYFGVYVAAREDIIPDFTVSYNYNNVANVVNPTDLKLYKRDNNASNAWVDAGAKQDVATATLTCAGPHTEYVLGSVGIVLPLQLLSFTAANSTTGTQLKWATANEKNTWLFGIEKSTDGFGFYNIGYQKTAGGGSNNYRFTDSVTKAGTAYYRLKMLDNDGQFTYSPIVSIANNNVQYADAHLQPTIATTSTYLQIINNNLLKTQARLVDMYGKTIQTITINSSLTPIDVAQLPNGLYFLQLQNGDVLKLVRQ